MKEFLMGLLSEPIVKEKIHKKMQKLENRLAGWACLYFGEDVAIMYVKKKRDVNDT